MSERRWDNCVSSQEVPANRSGVGYAFVVLGGLVLLLHHGWVAGLGREPHVELVFVGCTLVVVNAGGWVAPGVSAAVEGGADVAGWKRVLWWTLVASGASLLTWVVVRFGYG